MMRCFVDISIRVGPKRSCKNSLTIEWLGGGPFFSPDLLTWNPILFFSARSSEPKDPQPCATA